MRKTIRAQFATLIGNVLPNATVWPYRKADPKGVSPLVMVCSGGTARPRVTMKGSFPKHSIRVYSLVIHSAEDQEDPWTEAQAEDLLDDIEEAIKGVIDNNQKTDYWKSIEYEQPTEAERVVISGVPYLLEVYLLTFNELA